VKPAYVKSFDRYNPPALKLTLAPKLQRRSTAGDNKKRARIKIQPLNKIQYPMKNWIVKFKSYATSFFRLAATQKETLMCKLFPPWENDYPFCTHSWVTIL
jgi:hypothetical protein